LGVSYLIVLDHWEKRFACFSQWSPRFISVEGSYIDSCGRSFTALPFRFAAKPHRFRAAIPRWLWTAAPSGTPEPFAPRPVSLAWRWPAPEDRRATATLPGNGAGCPA